MIRPETGSRWKVSGNSMAMVAIGPMPGSTPMSVPISAPMNAKPRLTGVNATAKPVARLWNRSMVSKIRPDRDGEPKADNEDRPREENETDGSRDHFPRLDAARSKRTDADQREDRYD